VPARRDVLRDALKAAASPVLLPAGGPRWATAAWDAWDDVRRAVTAVARRRALPDADAGKLAAPEPGVQAPAGLARSVADAVAAAAEPGRPAEGQSAA